MLWMIATDSPNSLDHNKMEGPSGSLGSMWATRSSSQKRNREWTLSWQTTWRLSSWGTNLVVLPSTFYLGSAKNMAIKEDSMAANMLGDSKVQPTLISPWELQTSGFMLCSVYHHLLTFHPLSHLYWQDACQKCRADKLSLSLGLIHRLLSVTSHSVV